MAVETLVPTIVRAATTVAPALKDVRILRGFVAPLQGSGFSEATAVQELQAAINKRVKTRRKLRDQMKKRVLKVSDAMDCVENNVGNGKIALSFGRALVDVLAGGTGGNIELLLDAVNKCLIEHALPQTAKRKRVTYRYAKREI